MSEKVHNYYTNYIVSDEGYVKSKLTNKTLKPYKGHVYLRHDGETYDEWLDELVADCFLGPHPSGHVIYHFDRNRENCELSNIRYINKEQLYQLQFSEKWFDIPGYEGSYQITEQGDIRSLDRIITTSIRGKKVLVMQYGQPVATHVGEDDYVHVSLSSGGKTKLHSLHQLVAKTFIPNPDNLPQVNHKDGNKQKNYASNLEWVSHIGNMRHALQSGLWSPKKCGIAAAKKCGTPVRCITTGEEFLSINSAAKKFNMDYNSVKESADLDRPRKGYRFEYM